VKVVEIQQLLVPKVTVSKMKKNGVIYYVYLPQSFTQYLEARKWNVIVALGNKNSRLRANPLAKNTSARVFGF